ncbi:hypothetical protein V1520DRAFT_393572 [Lipomyces starkeyi]
MIRLTLGNIVTVDNNLRTNFGICNPSRVEGSHGAMKGALASSSGTLYAVAKKINHSGIERSQEPSVISSNENLSALELVYAEVVKKLHHQEEESTIDECSCTLRSRYLLPCLHQIQLGLPLDVTRIHPRLKVPPTLPALNITSQHLQPDVLSVLKDPQSALPRKGPEIMQKVADRIGKVRRCGSHHKIGHTRRKCPKLLNQQSSQGTDEGGCKCQENDAVDNTALEEHEAFHNRDEDDAIFEAMWADARCIHATGPW